MIQNWRIRYSLIVHKTSCIISLLDMAFSSIQRDAEELVRVHFSIMGPGRWGKVGEDIVPDFERNVL